MAKAHGALRKDSSREMREDLKLSSEDMKAGSAGVLVHCASLLVAFKETLQPKMKILLSVTHH